MGRKRHPEPLTPAEQRVLEEVRTGATNAEIAVRLGLSINTVKYHVANMLAKTGLDDRSALARWEMPRDGRENWWLRGAVAVGGVVGVVAVVLGVSTLVTEDAEPGDGVWVAYSPGPRTSTLPERILVQDLVSGEQRELVADNAWLLYAPQWSPTGEHLLALEFDDSGGPTRIVIFDRSDWSRTEVATGAFSAVWSPDGARILAVSNGAVIVLDPSGNTIARIDDQVGGGSGVLARQWSPDSSYAVVFREDRTIVVSRGGESWTIDDLPTFGDLPFGSSATLVGWSRDSSFALVAAKLSQDTFRIDPVAQTVVRLGLLELSALLDSGDVDVPTASGNDPCIVQYQPAAVALVPDRELQWAGPTVADTDCLYVGRADGVSGTRPLVVAGPSLPNPVSSELAGLDPQTMSVVVANSLPSPTPGP